METSKTKSNDAKKVFKELGTCSRTFFYLLNREFENHKETEERAADPLAGGIMQKGKQCGMLWGATLAVGTESYKRCKDRKEGIGLAIKATQHLVESFSKRTHTVNCRDITGCNLDSFYGMTKFMLKTTLKGMDNSTCFNLAEKWAPEAIEAAKKGLAHDLKKLPKQPISCASEVAKKMGATNEEMVTVAGFAGGLGLSGNACGALSAAIWMQSLAWSKENPGKSAYKNKNAKKTLKTFMAETHEEMNCQKICGEQFNTLEKHTNFIKNGGCKKLIDALIS